MSKVLAGSFLGFAIGAWYSAWFTAWELTHNSDNLIAVGITTAIIVASMGGRAIYVICD